MKKQDRKETLEDKKNVQTSKSVAGQALKYPDIVDLGKKMRSEKKKTKKHMSVLEASFNLLVVKHHFCKNSLILCSVWVGNGKAYPCFSWPFELLINEIHLKQQSFPSYKGNKKIKRHAMKRALS